MSMFPKHPAPSLRAGWLWLGLLAAHPAPAAEPLPASLSGVWRVVDSACKGCDPSQGAESGAELRLAGQGSQNPFGFDCSATLEVERLAPEGLPELQARLGLPARWLAGAGAAPAWRLVCSGTAHETVILLDNGALLLPGEADTVLHLTRVR